jgi:MFS transporter, ACS family, aldohexuronate transporter
MSAPAPPSLPSSVKWWVCILLLLASALNYMDRQALSQTAPDIRKYFGITNEEIGQLEGAFNAAFALGAILIGWAVDRGNVRLIYPAIVVLWSLAGFAAGFAEELWLLFVCRFALGLFEAGNVPCGVLTVKRVLPPEERALGNGMYQSGSALGAIITPLVVLLCLRIVERMGTDDPGIAWQLPFRVVGAAGLLWALTWFLIVRSEHVQPPANVTHAETDTYRAIFRNRRFWVCLAVVVSINSAWRSLGVWLPSFLQGKPEMDGKAYTRESMQLLSSGFFAAADIGSIAVGVVILRLARRGMPLARARLVCYAGCAGLTLLSVVAALLPKGPALVAALFGLGFGALGLFPIYYALSQEISAKHQGKVTGTLSFLNAVYLAGFVTFQGWLIERLQSYSIVLGLTGLFPLVGLVALWIGWKDPPAGEPRP